MYKFVFEIEVDEIGMQLQRLANVEKMADPYNDENSSFYFALPKSFDGMALVTWKTGQNRLAKTILNSLKQAC
jgi:hypothetical protein